MFIKKGLLVLGTLLLLVACKPTTTQQNVETTKFSIVSPSGAPALSLLNFISDENVEMDIVDGADVLAAEFSSAEKDFIIAPINLGVNLISKGAEYTLLSVITWGNLYLVGANEHLNTTKIAAFGEAAVPGRILTYLADVFKGVEIEYYNSVQEVSAALLADQYTAAVLAEPFLTVTKKQWSQNHEGELHEIYDIQALYKEKSSYSSYPQAALFVKSSLLESKLQEIMQFANNMDKAIESYNSDESTLINKIDSVDLSILGFANPDLIKEAYSRMALDFVFAYDCVNEITKFLDLFEIELKITSYIK